MGYSVHLSELLPRDFLEKHGRRISVIELDAWREDSGASALYPVCHIQVGYLQGLVWGTNGLDVKNFMEEKRPHTLWLVPRAAFNEPGTTFTTLETSYNMGDKDFHERAERYVRRVLTGYDPVP